VNLKYDDDELIGKLIDVEITEAKSFYLIGKKV
jgi:tRNA A37 methylthiotransferase MiaB